VRAEVSHGQIQAAIGGCLRWGASHKLPSWQVGHIGTRRTYARLIRRAAGAGGVSWTDPRLPPAPSGGCDCANRLLDVH